MFLNFKLFFIALAITSAAIAQETETPANTTIENPKETDKSGKNVGNIVIGPYVPIAFGDNFVNNGMDTKLGARFAFKINAYKGFYIGPYFSFFNAQVNDRQALGNYGSTTNYVFGALVGYETHIDKFDLSLGLGIGSTTYRNDGYYDNFSDTATSLWINPEIGYHITTYIGIYFAPELRHDFMNIDVPAELKDTFNGVNYVNLSFGLRINLGTAYKYM
jgi:uncharacterized membrane protein